MEPTAIEIADMTVYVNKNALGDIRADLHYFSANKFHERR